MDPLEGVTIRKGTGFFLMRQDYYELCKRDLSITAVLGYFDARWKMTAGRIKKACRASGLDYKFRENDFYVRVSNAEIMVKILGLYSRSYITKAIKFLVENRILIIVKPFDKFKNTPATYLLNVPLLLKYTDSFEGWYFNDVEQGSDFFDGCDTQNPASTTQNLLRPTQKFDTIKNKEDKQEDIDFKEKTLKVYGESADANSPMFPCQDVEDLFNHWNNLGPELASHRADKQSKTFCKSIVALQQALRCHSVEDIAEAMDRYYRILTSPESTLSVHAPGHKVPLNEFFQFSERTEELMCKSTTPLKIDNWFETCLKPYDELLAEFGKYIQDDHPKVSFAIRSKFVELFGNRRFSVSEENIFRKAARVVVQFLSENRNKLNWSHLSGRKDDPISFAKRLVESIKHECNNIEAIQPCWLLSTATLNWRFPTYLVMMGYLDKGTTITGDTTSLKVVKQTKLNDMLMENKPKQAPPVLKKEPEIIRMPAKTNNALESLIPNRKPAPLPKSSGNHPISRYREVCNS